jgi:hypothetical protein
MHSEAHLIKMTLRDGTVFSLTDWDKPLIANIDGAGAMTYASTHVNGLTAFSAQINTAIDDTELVVLANDDLFTPNLVRKGQLDGAKAVIALVDPDDLANPGIHRVYDVGQIRIEGATIRIELIGPEKRLEQNIGVSLTLTCRHHFGHLPTCGINLNVANWQPNFSYAVHDEIRPTNNYALWWRCMVAGVSGSVEPAWPNNPVLSEGSVTWKSFLARRFIGIVSGVTNRLVFTANVAFALPDNYGEGMLKWLAGSNFGQSGRIAADNGSGQLTLHIPAFSDIAVGDTFEAIVGCRHRLTEDCVNKHHQPESSVSRTIRFGGFPFLAPEDVTITAEKE